MMITANGCINNVIETCAEPAIITTSGRINMVVDDYTGSVIISVKRFRQQGHGLHGVTPRVPCPLHCYRVQCPPTPL